MGWGGVEQNPGASRIHSCWRELRTALELRGDVSPRECTFHALVASASRWGVRVRNLVQYGSIGRVLPSR